MKNSLNYNGRVTINYYDNKGNLKGSSVQYNHGTPYFFSVIENVLANGTNTLNDDRPGRIMLTEKGTLEVGVDTQGEYIKIELSNGALLSSNIKKSASPKTSQEGMGNENSSYNPFIRYEFNISYYDLVDTSSSGISNLGGYRLWLLSDNEPTFKINNIEIELPPSSVNAEATIENLLNSITYENVNVVSKICSQVQIPEVEEGEVNYSLAEGEYITVLWDMYFQNNSST